MIVFTRCYETGYIARVLLVKVTVIVEVLPMVTPHRFLQLRHFSYLWKDVLDHRVVNEPSYRWVGQAEQTEDLGVRTAQRKTIVEAVLAHLLLGEIPQTLQNSNR